MTKCLRLLLPAVFLLAALAPLVRSASPAGASTDLVPGQYAVVSNTGGYSLKLRAAPGDEAEVHAYLPDRTILRVLDGPYHDQQGWAWYLVTGFDRAGTRGWSVGYYLAPLQHPVLNVQSVSPRAPYRVLARITAYNGVEYNDPWGGKTRLGTMKRPGVVATDPSYIPLGSQLMIAGVDGVFVAEDTGSGVLGYHVDVYMPTYEAALELGSFWTYVTVFGRPYER